MEVHESSRPIPRDTVVLQLSSQEATSLLEGVDFSSHVLEGEAAAPRMVLNVEPLPSTSRTMPVLPRPISPQPLQQSPSVSPPIYPGDNVVPANHGAVHLYNPSSLFQIATETTFNLVDDVFWERRFRQKLPDMIVDAMIEYLSGNCEIVSGIHWLDPGDGIICSSCFTRIEYAALYKPHWGFTTEGYTIVKPHVFAVPKDAFKKYKKNGPYYKQCDYCDEDIYTKFPLIRL